jgi:similar to stage IV sporulation protein
MQGQWVLDVWRGYVVLHIKGGDCPGLLNLAHMEQIPLWNIHYHQDGSMRVYTYLKDFWRLRPLIKRTRCKLHVGKRVGVPFWIQRATRRKTFVAGFILFLVSLKLLTSFVWSVDIVGTKTISPESVQAALKGLGIYEGSYKGKIGDLDALQTRLLNAMPQLSWAGIQVHGTNVTVQVVEKKKSEPSQPTQPQNIVANKPGTISQVLATKGRAVVQKGQTVYPGEILISGDIGAEKPVAAGGIVKAQVWYTSKVEIPMQVVHQTYTGDKVKRDYLLLHTLPVQIWGYGQLPYQQYREISHDSGWSIAGFKLPIQFRTAEYYQVKNQTIQLTVDQARQLAMQRIRDNVKTKMDKDGVILKQDVLQEKQGNGKLYVEVLTEVEENIGIAKPMTSNFSQASPSQ